jgi:hypothetical protein
MGKRWAAGALALASLIAAAACGARSAIDAPPVADAGPDAFVACEDDAQVGVRVQGFMGDLEAADGGCKPVLPDGIQICWLGHQTCWSPQGLGPSTYALDGLPNAEIVLRATTATDVPRLEGIHPYDCLFQAYGFALPEPAFLSQILAPIGGFDPNKAYLLFYAEGESATVDPNVCAGNVAGFTVTLIGGRVYYANDTAAALDLGATATTASGLALGVLDSAPAYGADPLVVRMTAHRDETEPKCKMIQGVHWQRGAPSSETDFAADAPALAGHVTYALYVSCHPM